MTTYFVVLTIQSSSGGVETDISPDQVSPSRTTRSILFTRALDRIAATHQSRTGSPFNRNAYSVIFFSAEPNEVGP